MLPRVDRIELVDLHEAQARQIRLPVGWQPHTYEFSPSLLPIPRLEVVQNILDEVFRRFARGE